VSEPFKSSVTPPPQKPEAPPTMPQVLWAIATWALKRELLMRVAAVVVLLLAGGVTVVWAQDQRDAGVVPIKAALREHIAVADKRFEGLRDDVADLRRQMAAKEERDAARFDVIYSTILSGRRDPRAAELAQPQMDGGR